MYSVLFYISISEQHNSLTFIKISTIHSSNQKKIISIYFMNLIKYRNILSMFVSSSLGEEQVTLTVREKIIRGTEFNRKYKV